MARHTVSHALRHASLQIAAAFLLLASSGAALAQAAAPWRGSIECRLDVEQAGYSRHEIQTWMLTGAELPPNGDMRLYAADWTYRGDGKKNQNGVAAEWTVNVPPTSAPLAMVLRTADQRFIVRLWHSQLTSYAGLRVRTGASSQARQATEWQLPWIETAPKDDLEGTLSVQTAALSVDIAQFGAPTPTAACSYRFSRTALPAVPLTTQNTPRNAAPGRTPGSLISALPAPAAALPAPAAALPPPAAAPNGRQVTVTGGECKLAGPPRLQSLEVTPGRAGLAWEAAAGATGYTVARNDLGALTPAPITALGFRHDYVLDPRVTYQYSVTAVYARGCGTSTVSVKAEAPTPTDAHVTTGIGSARARTGRVTLTWQMGLDTNPSAFVVLGPGADQGVNVPPVKRVTPQPAGQLVDQFAETNKGTFGVDLDNVPEGQHTWRIAPAWDTPAGRSLTWDTAAAVTARVGVFRVLITGFKANSTTLDESPVNIDGQGDEIYVGAAAYIDGEAVGLAHSAVHGDVGMAPPPPLPGFEPPTVVGRVRAGNLSATGGIGKGDAVPYGGDPSVIRGAPSQTTFPLLVWEGWLGGETRVLVNPSIWEYDGDLGAFNQWQQLMLDTHPTRAASNTKTGTTDTREIAADIAVSKQALVRVGPANPLQQVQVDDARAQRDAIVQERERQLRESREKLEAPDTTAMQLIPRPVLPFHDRYVGTISKTPALALLSTSPAGTVSVNFKEPEKVGILEGGVPLLPLGGDYQIYVAIVPAQ